MLDHQHTQAVLDYLDVRTATPSLDHLAALVAAYVRRVPWESASRIIRRAQNQTTLDCPRWPVTFWTSALRDGTGGTCFESNYAFFALLRTLGYNGYLTINNMRASIGCHTAIVITLGGRRWLVDVGIPLHVPIPLQAGSSTRREGPFHTYEIHPQPGNHYHIERDRHPRRDIFTLVDVPVNDADYRAATTADYGADGLFLDRVIITRIVDERVWRFNGETPPYQLEAFRADEVTYHYLGDTLDKVAAAIAAKFALKRQIVHTALLATT